MEGICSLLMPLLFVSASPDPDAGTWRREKGNSSCPDFLEKQDSTACASRKRRGCPWINAPGNKGDMGMGRAGRLRSSRVNGQSRKEDAW
jgi:hypothetical protein